MIYFQLKRRGTLFFRDVWFFELREEGKHDVLVATSVYYPTRATAVDAIHHTHKRMKREHGPTVRGL